MRELIAIEEAEYKSSFKKRIVVSGSLLRQGFRQADLWFLLNYNQVMHDKSQKPRNLCKMYGSPNEVVRDNDLRRSDLQNLKMKRFANFKF